MGALLSNIASLFGLIGILISLVAGATRISGSYFLGGFELETLLTLGVALLITGCFLKLEVLTRE